MPKVSFVKNIVFKLVHSSRYEFEKNCIEILQRVMPKLRDSKQLGQFEREGIDAYVYDEEKNEYGIAFQFKGFEISEFLQSQKRQCLKSVQSFSKCELPFKEYILLTNLPVKDSSIKQEIDQALSDLTESKGLKARFMDPNSFGFFIANLYQKLVISKMKSFNAAVIDEYRQSMEQHFYLEDIPFEDKHRKLSNPTEHFILTKKYQFAEKAKWMIVNSEFGFGKTALVHHLAKRLFEANDYCIYIPFNYLSTRSYSNKTILCRDITRLLLYNDLDAPTSPSDEIIFGAMIHMLTKENHYTLIMDGLDECSYAYRSVGLRYIFQVLKTLKSNVVITCRTEFFNERIFDIESNLSSIKKNIEIIRLTAWTNSDILGYMGLMPQPLHARILWFQEMVVQNRYDEFFGDIPKRPLFLKMLLNDLVQGNDITNNISVLYANYFREKFKLDISGYADRFPERPLNLPGGAISQFETISSLLADIAIMMVSIPEEGEPKLDEHIIERDIYRLLTQQDLKDIVEFLVHSVLVPIDKKYNQNFKLKFAHKSYQEFFTARYLFACLQSDRTLPEERNHLYPDTVIRFLNAMMEAEEIRLQNQEAYRFLKQVG